jgi:bifunctional non-homologous end joining protein LigD
VNRLPAVRLRRSAPSLEAHFDLNQTNEPILVKNKRERKDFIYVGKVGTGFNRKSSMEIRKKLDAILSSKSRLAKAPRLKGATWVLRADR